ncbi:MAG: M20/M25/M40 family metallo-hydrolase [Eubacterium sp.]|nr:M20/M25/M40 family metallo-hydrolase [Eubacterium sp.]
MCNINENRLLALFKKLVETDSPSGAERQVCDILKTELANLNVSVSEDNAGEYINGNAGNLYAYVEGDVDLSPILFSAHMDTVEPAKNKKCIIDDNGKIHSDGSTVLGSDDFAGVCAIIEVLKTVKENNLSHRPIEIIFSVSEENYCKGISQFDFNKVKSKEAYVFDLSGEVGTAAYAAPTILSFKADIIGKSSHAGFAPEQGIHSIKIAAEAILKINCGKIDAETTINIGTINGGTATNIVPDKCSITGEIRSYSDTKAVEQYNNIEKIITETADKFGAVADISFTKNITAYETDVHHKVVERFKNVCNDLQLMPKMERSFGGSDNNVMAQNGINGIVVATAMNECHTLNEWTTVDELKNAAELALNLMISKE